MSFIIGLGIPTSFVIASLTTPFSLKNGSRVTSWEKANRIYNKIIHFFMN
ncbi:MAG: hypothetical protein PHQ70_09035 [Arcobacter sp.]|jgi:hypothetical protein|nr:hypothetical protein [Arcobacter sp.]